MLNSAKKNDQSFPDSKSAKLTSFAYVCRLQIRDKIIRVVNLRQVLTDMAAPRGMGFIALFDESGAYLTKYRYTTSEPLWCENDKIYLFGNYQGPLSGACEPHCNVMRIDSEGRASLLHEKAYGSSGGNLDN